MAHGRPFVEPGARAQVQLPDRTLEVRGLHCSFASLSPDGTGVVSMQPAGTTESAGYGLFVSRLDGSEARKIFKPEMPVWATSWSREGSWITYTVGPLFAPPSAHADIWKVRPDGTGAVNLTGDSKANNAFPDISGDGRRIVFRSGRDGNKEIYMMDADGTNVRRLTNHPATDTMPAISPKGDMVAFCSDRDGDFEIYVQEIAPDGSLGSLRRRTFSRGPDMHPRFSPDGKWIVFASARGGLNDEPPLCYFNPQPYGEIWAMWADIEGPTVRLTHNKWEDSIPAWGPVRQ